MHGWEPTYMVGSPHTWWPGQPAGQLWGAGGSPTRCQTERGWNLGTLIGTSIGPFAHSTGPVEQNKLLGKENSASQNIFHGEVCLQTYTECSDLGDHF